MRAVVSVTFDNEFAVHDIKIIEGDGKCFLAMPSRRGSDGSFRDICHPITAAVREQLENEVIERYHTSLL